MKKYPINKGIARPTEFKGLKSQYLFIFAGGLLGVFILFVILYMIGISQTVCITIGVILALMVVWGTFYLNRKYGEHGLMKLSAVKRHPRYILNRISVRKLIKHSYPKNNEEHNESGNTGR